MTTARRVISGAAAPSVALMSFAPPASESALSSSRRQFLTDVNNMTPAVTHWDTWWTAKLAEGGSCCTHYPPHSITLPLMAALSQLKHEMLTQTWPECRVETPLSFYETYCTGDTRAVYDTNILTALLGGLAPPLGHAPFQIPPDRSVRYHGGYRLTLMNEYLPLLIEDLDNFQTNYGRTNPVWLASLPGLRTATATASLKGDN